MSSAIVLGRERVAWRQAHEALVRLASERAGLDFEEGRALLRAHRSGVHARLGYASFDEYTERLFGYGPRLTRDKLRVAEALEELPETARDLQTGAISFSHARELTRVATPSTETEWLEAARGRTVREVEHLVSGHRPGSLPDDVPDSRLKRHMLHLELSGEVFATFREAVAKIRREAGESIDEEAALLLLCRQALEGNRDPGRSSYQIALTVCEHCRRATQQGRGEAIEVGPEIVEMAECDGQHIGHVDALSVHRDGAGRAHVGVDGDETADACNGVDASTHPGAADDELARAHMGAVDAAIGRARVSAASVRATQTIPPATRRAVLRRDGGKCRVPGCRHAVFTEPHHIGLRSEGGDHDPENLLTLCGAHHLAVHRGRLSVTGKASSPRFAHADGTSYGAVVGASSADARAKAFRALRALGFREGDATRALEKIPTTLSSLEQIIRQALRELAPQ
ncbi:MAG TPA: hypothetical protein VFV94_05395 [Polyangiaceae bacterium]|nr:hypothetical protein [Polyangiaceae bacterium]